MIANSTGTLSKQLNSIFMWILHIIYWAVINHALTHTYTHPPTPTHTQPIKSHTHPHYSPTSTLLSKKRSHSSTPTHTQPKKGHIHPHPPTPSQKKVTFIQTYLQPAKKWPHLPTPTHTQPKKVTHPHTYQHPDKKGHSQPKEGHAHSRIIERKNVTCLKHT